MVMSRSCRISDSRRGTPRFRASLRALQASRRSGERGLADRDQQVVVNFSGQYVIFLLKPGQLGFQVAYSALKAAHL